MRLHKAALFFDRDSVYDAYTGLFLWKAQFSGFDGAKPDGSFERRRTISVAPGTVNAPRRAIKVQGIPWILGDFVQDTFFDKPIRLSGAAKLVTDEFHILSPAQAANKTVLTPVYAQAKYLKSTVDGQTTSDLQPFYEVFFSITENIPQGYFLRSANNLLRVRGSHKELEGFTVLEADIVYMSGSVVSGNGEVAVTVAGVFDPVTESYTSSQTVNGILLDIYMMYQFKTEADRLDKQGDKTLVLPNTVTIAVGDTVTINSQAWQVKTKSPYHDAWNLHIRRA